MTITDTSVIVAVREQISTDLGGERVILHPETGQYLGLSEVGATIWDSVQEPTRLSEIHEQLLEEYTVDSDQCYRDLRAFVEELRAAKLVTVE